MYSFQKAVNTIWENIGWIEKEQRNCCVFLDEPKIGTEPGESQGLHGLTITYGS